jgi:hypothetical protein
MLDEVDVGSAVLQNLAGKATGTWIMTMAAAPTGSELGVSNAFAESSATFATWVWAFSRMIPRGCVQQPRGWNVLAK